MFILDLEISLAPVNQLISTAVRRFQEREQAQIKPFSFLEQSPPYKKDYFEYPPSDR